MEKNKGPGMHVFLFVAAFFTAIIGVYVFMKADDTAYMKASDDVIAMRATISRAIDDLKVSVNEAATAREDLRKLCVEGFENSRQEVDRLRNQILALELEVQRVKEKQVKINTRLIPTTHNLKIELSEPVPVKVHRPPTQQVPVDILERAGLKKPKK